MVLFMAATWPQHGRNTTRARASVGVMQTGIPAALPRAVVIENDELLASTIESLLLDDGWSTLRFASLEAAARAFTAMPELLILDLKLGDRHGTELLAELASRSDAPPTVLVSAGAELGPVAERFGVVPVRKPFDLDRLLAAIRRAIADDHRPSIRA
jgi:DNA-binding response OmpR family regulator